MPDIAVSYAALKTAEADITTGSNELKQALSTLQGAMTPLRANWTGEAASAYDTANRNWTASIEDMTSLLVTVGTMVKNSADSYAAVDKAGANHFNG